jgi:DNA-binding LacI/PurR family transcriptional regulator
MEELRRRGYAVPREVAIVGFDDITFASLVEPRLTTIAQPKYRMGCLAMERLLDLLGNGDRRPRRTVLEPELIVRDSCGARLRHRAKAVGA